MGIKISNRFRATVMLGASITTTNRPSVDLLQYAFNTSRAIPAYNEDGSWFFYDYEAGYTDIPLPYNVFNELHHSGAEDKTRSVTTNINLDYKFASWLLGQCGSVL